MILLGLDLIIADLVETKRHTTLTLTEEDDAVSDILCVPIALRRGHG
jgi:hypothetical protein